MGHKGLPVCVVAGVDSGRWRVLGLLTLAVMLTMSLWFTASAIAPTLARLWRLPADATWLASAIQLGFVAGALGSASTGLPDRLPSRRLFAAAAVAAAVTNWLFVLLWWSPVLGLLLRFLTGAALAGVYPVAVQLATGWFPRQRGLALGILIGGITVGSALPHLLLGLGAVAHWKWLMVDSSGLALSGAVLVGWWLPNPPRLCSRPAPFRWDSLGKVVRDRPVLLASIGYFGHNWELYGMWSWLPLFLIASWSGHWQGSVLVSWTAWVAFASMGVAGAWGALLGGWAAERWGRTATTTGALVVSGLMALSIGFTYRAAPWLTVLMAMVWGISVVADSAQFSTMVTELAASDYLGSALTFQMAVGFLVTVGSVGCVGWLLPLVGWPWAFYPLALGPGVGIWAILSLRRRPEALLMANGRR